MALFPYVIRPGYRHVTCAKWCSTALASEAYAEYKGEREAGSNAVVDNVERTVLPSTDDGGMYEGIDIITIV